MSKLFTKIQLLDEKAVLPSRAHEEDTGYDLTFIGVKKIVGDVIFFKTGLAIQPPSGFYFEIVPRSSISKLPLEMANSIGIIDEHYRGEILVPIRITHPSMGQEQTNTSFPQGMVKIFGTRPPTMSAVAQQVLANKPELCQLIMRKRLDSEFQVVNELAETIRGDGGFGSTDEKEISKSEEEPQEDYQSGLVEVERIDKPWGYEEIFAKNDCYAGKKIFIRRGESLSKQYHQVKKETILVQRGELELQIEKAEEQEVYCLESGQSFHIEPGTIHRFRARDGDVHLIEISTPELDDVVRLEDQYGRITKSSVRKELLKKQ